MDLLKHAAIAHLTARKSSDTYCFSSPRKNQRRKVFYVVQIFSKQLIVRVIITGCDIALHYLMFHEGCQRFTYEYHGL